MGGETGTCEKAVLYFCETNKQVNVAERKGKGRRQHMTNNEWGGKQERMLSRKKWQNLQQGNTELSMGRTKWLFAICQAALVEIFHLR